MIAVLIFYLREVEFFPGYVKKPIPHSSMYMTTTEFEELYHAIWVEKPASIINLYKLPTPGRHSTSLLLTSIGYPASPSTIDELKLAVKDSLSGLQWLHTKGFVHRDVRWPNITRKADGLFLVIDLELAGKEGEVDPTLSSSWWPALEEQKF